MEQRILESKELDLILDEINDALDKIRIKYNLKSLELGDTKYNAFSFVAKLEGSIDSELESNFKKHQAEYFAQINGLPIDFINREFHSGGLTYTIVQLEPRNRKYPIIVHCKQKDQSYKFSVAEIKKVLG